MRPISLSDEYLGQLDQEDLDEFNKSDTDGLGGKRRFEDDYDDDILSEDQDTEQALIDAGITDYE